METKKVWFVTGASKGLGLALVKQLLRDGYWVAATSRDAAALSIAVNGDGAGFLALQVDLLDEISVGLAISETIVKFGTIDVIVNNAGYGQIGTLEELTDKEARENFNVNVFGPLNVVRAVMPFFRNNRAGHIINVSSVAGVYGAFAGFGVYCATKFAMAGFTESLSAEVAEFGVKATIVYPGYFRTNFLDGGSLNGPDHPIKEYTAARSSEQWHESDMKGKQPGSPEKAAHAFIQLAERKDPPLHFFMGSDALTFGKLKIDVLKDAVDVYDGLSKSTDY